MPFRLMRDYFAYRASDPKLEIPGPDLILIVRALGGLLLNITALTNFFSKVAPGQAEARNKLQD